MTQSNIPDQFLYIKELPMAEIERKVQVLRNKRADELSKEDLQEAVALHTIARLKTSGPPKTRSPGATGKAAPAQSMGDLAKQLGLPE